MVVSLLFITFNRSVTTLTKVSATISCSQKMLKFYTHTPPSFVGHFRTPGSRCPSASHSSSQAIGSPSLNPSRSEHRGFIYTGLMFLPSAHHIGGKVWKSTEQSRACLSPPANMKPVLAPSRQSLHQQLVSSLWRLKPAKDLLIRKKEFKQSWDYTKSWKRAHWKRWWWGGGGEKKNKPRPHQLHVR